MKETSEYRIKEYAWHSRGENKNIFYIQRRYAITFFGIIIYKKWVYCNIYGGRESSKSSVTLNFFDTCRMRYPTLTNAKQAVKEFMENTTEKRDGTFYYDITVARKTLIEKI